MTGRNLAWIAAPLLGLLVRWAPWPAAPALPMPFGEPEPQLSRDGRFLVYTAQRSARPGACFGRRGTRDLTDVWRLNLAEGSRLRLSQGPQGQEADGPSCGARVSADGSRVVFCSEAANLVAGDRNAAADVFLFDQARTGLTRLKPDPHPSSAPALSGDGGVVAFSRQGQLVLLDLKQDRPIPAVFPPFAGPLLGPASFAPEGREIAVALAGPAQDCQIWAAHVDPGGLGSLAMVSQPGQSCFSPVLGGPTCAFEGARDLFVRTLPGGKATRVRGSEGEEPDGDCMEPALSADGRWLAFTSYAGNLAEDDANHQSDVFLLDRRSGEIELISRTPAGRSGNGPSYSPTLSGDGSRLVFASRATDLEDTPAAPGQLYLWERGRDRLSRLAP